MEFSKCASCGRVFSRAELIDAEIDTSTTKALEVSLVCPACLALEEKVSSPRPYWYRMTTYYCVQCGRERHYRERVYDESRPEEWDKRNEFHEELCYGCLV
jgi:hypothetical protein